MLCHRVEEELLRVRISVDPLVNQLISLAGEKADYCMKVGPLVDNMLKTLDDVMATFKKALLFNLVKVRTAVHHACSCVQTITVAE